jgi:hypothetical protein
MINALCGLQGELGMLFEGVQGAFRVSPPVPSSDPAIDINMFAVLYWCYLPIKRRLGRHTRRGMAGSRLALSRDGGSSGRNDLSCRSLPVSSPIITRFCPIHNTIVDSQGLKAMRHG